MSVTKYYLSRIFSFSGDMTHSTDSVGEFVQYSGLILIDILMCETDSEFIEPLIAKSWLSMQRKPAI